jgi:hypothetical protein
MKSFSKKSPLRVLMLDHEPLMVDRRIILEAETLVNCGAIVVLATQGDGIKPHIEQTYGLKIIRFTNSNSPVSQDEEVGLDRVNIARAKIQQWSLAPGNYNREVFVRNNFRFLPKKIQSFLYALLWPPIMVARVKRLDFLSKIMGRFLDPFIYASMLRPKFLLPYIQIFIYKMTSSGKANKASVVDESNLQTWQQQILEFSEIFAPHVVHSHDLPNLLLGKLIAQRLNIPLIYDAHELYTHQYFSDQKYRQSLLEAEKKLIPFADKIISINRQCVAVLEKTYNLSGVVAINNATTVPKYFDLNNNQKLWHKKFGLTNDVKIMVFQGGINPVRNIDELVKSLVCLPDNIHVGFITYKKDIPYYENLAIHLGVSHRIHYVVEIPWDEVIYWLASADIGIMPYQVTNFNAKIASPNKLYEFVAAGLPFVASTELENVRLAIEEDGIGLACLLKEPDTYNQIIKEIFSNENRLNDLRANVLSVRDKYLWTTQEPILERIYVDLTADNYVCRANKKI